MIRRTFLLIVSGTVLAALPTPALAAPADIAATRTYVQANYALVQAAGPRIPAARAAIAGVLRQVKRECPGIAAGSPQNAESTQLSNEVIGAMVISAYHLDVPALKSFVRATERLRWSNRGLTSAVHAYAANLKTLSVLAVPNVCGDVKAWIAGGFHSLPASTVAFAPRFMSAWVALGEVPSQLTAYERGDERAMLSRSHQLEDQLTNFEAAAVESWGEIMNAIGLNP